MRQSPALGPTDPKGAAERYDQVYDQQRWKAAVPTTHARVIHYDCFLLDLLL